MTGVQTIGIIGGGQLGRMLTLAALPLGFRVVVVEPSRHSPAAQVGATEITGDLYDKKALKKLAELADYITIEIEHLDAGALEEIAALGKPVNPSPQTISLIQDKLRQKKFLAAAGIPVAPFAPIKTLTDAKKAFQAFGRKMLIKARHGAYDGRGNLLVSSEVELKEALKRFEDRELYAEQFVPFKKELAVMVARGFNGEVCAYPVAETVHRRNICVEVRVPADVTPSIRQAAEALAVKTAEHLEGAGVFGIEMFLTDKNNVIVNEVAPRVHNSGHYTMDACRTSQFEQHIRAISGLPLGSTDMLVPAAVMINILGERNGETELKGLDQALAQAHTNVHVYGKSPTKIDRKMGHITATGKTITEAQKRATAARERITL